VQLQLDNFGNCFGQCRETHQKRRQSFAVARVRIMIAVEQPARFPRCHHLRRIDVGYRMQLKRRIAYQLRDGAAKSTRD
jgi:hypothetical protein